VTVSKTQRIDAKESAEAKAKRRYEKLRYICNHNSLTCIAIQPVTATRATFKVKNQSNEIVTKLCHFLAFH
ncbi:MAG: hypothetical protein IJ494_07865, partial [Bacteroides sp.]|nr:hypothetical protein [Bacteroides sp.]